MSKLLIHIGPPKTGSTQLQKLFNSNSMVLRDKSIDYIQCKPKKQIRSYFRAYKKINRWKLRSGNPLKPWYLDCPGSYFFKKSSNDNAIISEEALFKIAEYSDEVSGFDKFLSGSYSNRLYLAVLREVNGHTISQISQSIKGVQRFDYKNCLGRLKHFSLDADFLGVINTSLDLEVATFSDLVVDSECTENTSLLLENFFGVSNIDLKAIEGVRNASLGAEGTAVHMAYNNIIRLIMGGEKLHQLRKHIIPFARQFRTELLEQFPQQQKFCPFTKDEQSRFCELQLAKSQKFIKRFPGNWIDNVFTPVIQEKKITFISELDGNDRNIMLDFIEDSIHKIANEPCFNLDSMSSTKTSEAVSYFIKNEHDLVL